MVCVKIYRKKSLFLFHDRKHFMVSDSVTHKVVLLSQYFAVGEILKVSMIRLHINIKNKNCIHVCVCLMSNYFYKRHKCFNLKYVCFYSSYGYKNGPIPPNCYRPEHQMKTFSFNKYLSSLE